MIYITGLSYGVLDRNENRFETLKEALFWTEDINMDNLLYSHIMKLDVPPYSIKFFPKANTVDELKERYYTDGEKDPGEYLLDKIKIIEENGVKKLTTDRMLSLNKNPQPEIPESFGIFVINGG